MTAQEDEQWEELHDWFNAFSIRDSEALDPDWRKCLVADLRSLAGRAVWQLEVDGDKKDLEDSASLRRIMERVIEAEDLL